MAEAKVIIGSSKEMPEIECDSIGLIVTSPPYWNIKDYSAEGQIGYGQTLEEYYNDLNCVWKECYRVLKEGRRLCINVGDMFTRTSTFGKHKIVPLHAKIIIQCEEIGFDYMGSIIWQKRATKNTSGGASIMGSYPYPPNGMIEIDYEYILIFKKPVTKEVDVAGRRKRKQSRTEKIDKEIKARSVITKDEWKQFFSGHWKFSGVRQIGHPAMFPYELPRRLIKMFSFVNDTVLDPFLGSGTTIKAALDLDRNAVGYDIVRYPYLFDALIIQRTRE